MTCNKFFHASKVKNCFAQYHIAHLNAGQDVEEDDSDPDGDIELQEMVAEDVRAMLDEGNAEERGYARLAMQEEDQEDVVDEEVLSNVEWQLEDSLG